MKSLSQSAHHIGGQPMFKLLDKARLLEAQGQRILHFEIGDPYFKTPHHIVGAAKAALDADQTHYTSSAGLPALLEEIAVATQKDLGFRPSLDQILVMPANASIYFLIRCVVNPGEEVIVPDPGFSTYLSAAEFVGAVPVSVPLKQEHEFRMQASDIAAKITSKTRLIIINSPNNPTGSVMTDKEIQDVAQLAKERDIYLLSDEVYRKMVFTQAPMMSAGKIDQCRERTILMNSFSKSHAMSGFRLGYLIGPSEVIQKMALMLQTIWSCLPAFVQQAGVAALSGASEDVMRSMLGELRSNRDLMVNGLNELPGVQCLVPQGAFYVFPNIQKTGLSSTEFADLMLEEAGVALLPGSVFGAHGEGYARLCYATPKERIVEALGKMKKALTHRLVKI